MSFTNVFGHDDRTDFTDFSHTAEGLRAGDGLREWNGNSRTSGSVAASGNQRIDGLLGGNKWLGNITYSAPNALSDYQGGYFTGFDTTDFSKFTAQQMVAFHFALDANKFTQPAGAKGFAVEGFTNLNIAFSGGGSGSGTIRGANMDDANPTAYAYYPSSGIYGGDTFFGDNYDGTSLSYKTPKAGNYAWHTMLHELGHSLGLKHGHQGGGPANKPLPLSLDSVEFSVMTYKSYIGADPNAGYSYGQWDGPQTYMMLDIAALQYIYGADFTANAGNTVYKWNPGNGITRINGAIGIAPGGNNIFATIWDGNGIDTYDLSAYTTALKINLEPGAFSVFSSVQLADLGGGPNGGNARGNIFNAMQFKGDARSLIERAIGGSGNDSILGNDADNQLTGNAGNDFLSGYDGSDKLIGGIGNDKLNGGVGKDFLTGGTLADTFVFSAKTHSGLGTNADIITDFDDGNTGDRIDLSLVYGPTLVYRHALAFTGIGQVRINDVAGPDVLVEVNTGGSLFPEFSIRLAGTTLASMAANDFIL